jgi:cell division protein FtsW
MALGLSFTLIIQAIANMAVTVNIVPVTGVTLPLISMGGSSFIFTCCSIGLILSVARNVEQLEGKAPVETEIEIPADENTDSNNSPNSMMPSNA